MKNMSVVSMPKGLSKKEKITTLSACNTGE